MSTFLEKLEGCNLFLADKLPPFVAMDSTRVRNLIAKWSSILLYTSDRVPPLAKEMYPYGAWLLESYEAKYLHMMEDESKWYHTEGNRIMKILIPTIRRCMGPVEIIESGYSLIFKDCAKYHSDNLQEYYDNYSILLHVNGDDLIISAHPNAG